MTTPPTRTARADGYCCDEYAAMAVSRRGLLGGAAALAGATTMVGGAVVTASPARAASATSVLVVVSLRGGADGLSLVVPHGDPGYYAARPGIAIPSRSRLLRQGRLLRAAPGHGRPGAALDRRQGGSGPRHRAAGGQPVALRRDGGDGGRRPGLQRARRLAQPAGRAAPRVPRRCRGSVPAPAPSPPRWSAPRPRCPPAGSTTSSCRAATRTAAARSRCRPCGTARSRRWAAACGRRSRPSTRSGRPRPPRTTGPPTRAPGSVASLATAAQIIRGDVGVEVITVDQGDWDMHTDMGSVGGGWMWQQRRGPRLLDRGVLHRPRHPGEQGHPGDAERVRPSGRRERQRRDGPRLRQRHVRRRRRRRAAATTPAGRGWPTATKPTCTVTTDYRQVLADIVVEAVQRLGGEGVPRAEVAAHEGHVSDGRRSPATSGRLAHGRRPEPLTPLDESWERALCVVAHPDDLEFGAAAAVARWTGQGKTVVYCMVTSGEAGIDGMDPDECRAGPRGGAAPVRRGRRRRHGGVPRSARRRAGVRRRPPRGDHRVGTPASTRDRRHRQLP